MTSKFIEIENKAGNLKLNDTVSKESADSLIGDIEKLYGQDAVNAMMQIGDAVCVADDAIDTLNVEINTPGGSVMEGHRIFNTLRQLSARGVTVETTVNGLAASMGSVILMAGDTRKITNGSRIMIHEASMMAYGNAKQLKKGADMLDGVSSEIAGIYAERTGGDQAEIRNLMVEETWMDAAQAKELNFVDAIIKDGKEQTTENELKPELLSTPSNTEMTNPFKPNEELQAKFDAASVENDALALKITGYEEVMKDDAEAIANFQISETNLKAENVTLGETVATLTTSLEESTAKQEDFDKKVEDSATLKVAALGHGEPIEVITDTETKSLYDQYKELKSTNPTKAGAFWRANEAAIKASV